MTSHLLHHLFVGPTFSQATMPADDVPPEGSLLYELGARPAQDGVWAGAGGCFLIRGVQFPHELARAAKEVERTHPNPVPGGTSPAASNPAADPVSERLRRSLQSVVLARRPYSMQHDGQLARQCDFGLAQTPTRRQAYGPRL